METSRFVANMHVIKRGKVAHVTFLAVGFCNVTMQRVVNLQFVEAVEHIDTNVVTQLRLKLGVSCVKMRLCVCLSLCGVFQSRLQTKTL